MYKTIKSQKFIRSPLFITFLLLGLTITLLFINRSFFFEYSILSEFGDQKLYYELAFQLSNLDFVKSPYTIGYPLLFLPFIFLTSKINNWESIIPFIIFIQSIILVPFSFYLIFKYKSFKYKLITFGIISVYLLFLLTSKDPLTKYNFLGLIPLSEPLTAFCLVVSYWLYLSKIRFKNLNSYLIVLGFFFAYVSMVRQTSVILLAPIVLDILLNKEFKKIIVLGITSAIFFLPQIFYNYKVSGELFFNSYKWWADGKVEKNNASQRAIYGFSDESIFSIKYFFVNVSLIFFRYVPILALVIGVLVSNLKQLDRRFTVLVISFTVINIVLHLAYWWSSANDLIDRFLLPNLFVLLFIFGNNLLKKNPHESYR